MRLMDFVSVVMEKTGTVLCASQNYGAGSHVLFPPASHYFPELGLDDVQVFWARFFARNAHFDIDGNLTEDSRENILSHLEAIQVAARSISLELLRETSILAAHVRETIDSN